MSDAWAVEPVEDDKQKELEEFVYGLMGERDRLQLRVGVLEAQVEEVKALIANAWGTPAAINVADLRAAIEWHENQKFYDQSWRWTWWHETLADSGHLCGRDHEYGCEGCEWLEEENDAEDEMPAV